MKKDLEKRIIQALLFEKNLNEIYKKIDEEMFLNEQYAFIFTIGRQLWQEQKPADLTAIFEHISLHFPDFYVDYDELLSGDVKNVFLLVENFVEAFLKRKIKEKVAMLNLENYSVDDIMIEINNIRRFIDKYSFIKIPTVETIKNDLEFAFSKMEEKLIKTGFRQLDLLLNGGYRTGVSFIGAYTKVGKSCFARNLGYNVARQHKVAYFNFELDKHEFLKKMIKIYEVNKVLTQEEAIADFLKEYEQDQMIILNQHSRKIKNVISTIEYLANERGVKFFVIDTFDKLLNEEHDSWFGFTKNILLLEETALANDIVILALKQLQVSSTQYVKDDTGRHYKKKVNPKTQRPSIDDSVGTKEPARTASSFITMFWDKDDWSIVHFVEQAERYNQAGLVDFKFYKETETYREVENSLYFS